MLNGKHMKPRPGSKDLRTREQGEVFSRHKTLSSPESKQVFSIWLVDVTWVLKSKDGWRQFVDITRQCDGDLVFRANASVECGQIDGLWEGLTLFPTLLPFHAPRIQRLIVPESKDSRTLACWLLGPQESLIRLMQEANGKKSGLKPRDLGLAFPPPWAPVSSLSR